MSNVPIIYDVLRDLVPFVQFKNVKNTYEGVLLLVKLQAKNILHKFSELYKFYISFLGV